MKFDNKKAILFDLDGTLADTAQDLAYALNQVLIEQNKAPLAFEKIRPVVSHGGIALIKLGFNLTPDDNNFEPLRQRLLAIYQDNICRKTCLFPNLQELLNYLKDNNILWGIVTNKPGWLTHPLLAQMQIQPPARPLAEWYPYAGESMTAAWESPAQPKQSRAKAG